ncbi:insulinase family protein [Pontixanthobacter aestiaquae]|uniref:Insulinase family protein n=1 Tax=Pontixanthobacter aestiaquae TaxID=1509367 RepID=A0A844Z5B6_9SPHN|nr:M16 family metallopeptidase [Pontixanthobacter aestiaquae]MDN3645891.1 insulinase family protein [Pontixanthobacter aestiaquae]MXO83115.1 insulinase family protein [Pontixanthobacter aestiaquae]
MISRFSARAALSLLLTSAIAAPLGAQDMAAPKQADDVQEKAAADPVKLIFAEAKSDWDPTVWDLEDSEFVPEDGWQFGKLENGMRYIIRRNDRPENTALVRMEVDTGSINEREEERGFAHYVEHMAFNGSTNVPEGEMVKLLERKGLAFGADTNASTGFERTQYKLNLPKADPDLLDTALMLMRETASELTIAEEAVERERGVILSERRVRNNYSLKNVVDSLEFGFPGSHLSQRLPIGTLETLEAADAKGLRAFWEREYVPANTVLVVVGDFEPSMVEGKIRERFEDWKAVPIPEQIGPGPVDTTRTGETDIYLDPALTESISIFRHVPFVDEPDTLENRQKAMLLRVGRGALSRRFQRLNRSEDPPFRSVSFGANEFFDEAETIQLSVSTEEGGWKRGLDTAIDEFRRALQFGFSEAEVAEQVTNMRTGYEDSAANAGTRSNGLFVNSAFAMARGDRVVSGPSATLERFNAFADKITPEAVLKLMRAEYNELGDPLIRFSGKTAPEGGAAALRSAVEAAYARELAAPEFKDSVEFAYTEFGTPGAVVSDTTSDDLGIRTLRFANGVMLNLKQTDLQDNAVNISLYLDGGRMLRTRDDPLAVELAGLLSSGGLGKHSTDELQSILAGRSVSGSFGLGSDTFVSRARTTPRDFELQMQLLAAFVTDPGYRTEGLGPWKKSLDDFFARLGKTPGSAYSEGSRAILSDSDPRFTRQPVESYRALDYDKLSETISDRLATGAIEIAIVGDIDEQEAVNLVSKTFGALPTREDAFRPYDDKRRMRPFTSQRGLYTITHGGEADQAMIRLIWPTTDDSDWELTSQLSLLARVARLKLTEKLREELGQTYSPSVSSSQSDTYVAYGTFSMGASVDVTQLDATKAALMEVIEDLIANTPDEDLMQRARQPVLEALENRLKSNSGWMSLVDRAQSDPDDIKRFQTAKERYSSMTGDQLQALAAQYLQPDDAIEFRVVPQEPAPNSE